jgi:formamidopyrimidine-DNA glycosylase
MPELPEVETVRRGLDSTLAGVTLERVTVLRERAIAWPTPAEDFCRALAGTRIGPWRRRGKYLLTALSRPERGELDGEDAGTWAVHLRMTGQFLWLSAPLPPPCRHTRVRFEARGGQELRFVDTRSFGQMWWIPADCPPEALIGGLRDIGPEPLGDAFSTAWLEQTLRRTRRPIKSALLDQRVVAGVGNIYADESLFAAGIAPHTPAGSLGAAALDRLRRSLVEVLRISIGQGGTTFRDFRDLSGRNGNYGGRAWVYRRTGEPCRRCGSPIRRDRLSGRSSHWCPSCQH